jgi:hypothetical protein
MCRISPLRNQSSAQPGSEIIERIATRLPALSEPR